MRYTKVEKGITLIALIITIIILLILAVVTIGNIKNSNIITYAQNAASDYNKEKEKETTALSDYEEFIEKQINKEEEEIIEYYSCVVPESTDMVIQKIKYDKSKTTASIETYFKEETSYSYDTTTIITLGDPIEESVEITLHSGTKTINTGAIPVSIQGTIAAYFYEDKLYTLSGGSAYGLSLDKVTTQSQIEEIEQGIASI